MTNNRIIALDTETTGLTKGDRLIEIACVELRNRVRTGNKFHVYVNPMIPISEGASRIHGITDAMVADKDVFANIANDFIEFIEDSELVIHNADFDLGFLNKELGLLGHQLINRTRVTDTLQMARRKFPGSPASLDALCKKFDINLDERDKHGALIDANLLAMVYLNLTGSTQTSFELNSNDPRILDQQRGEQKKRSPRSFPPSAQELEKHTEFLKQLKTPIW